MNRSIFRVLCQLKKAGETGADIALVVQSWHTVPYTKTKFKGPALNQILETYHTIHEHIYNFV